MDRDRRGRAAPDFQVLPFLLTLFPSTVTDRSRVVTGQKQPKLAVLPNSGRSVYWSIGGPFHRVVSFEIKNLGSKAPRPLKIVELVNGLNTSDLNLKKACIFSLLVSYTLLLLSCSLAFSLHFFFSTLFYINMSY